MSCIGRRSIAWTVRHRSGTTEPMCIWPVRVEDVLFQSYIFVTQIVEGKVSNLSTGIVTGSVRSEASNLKISSLHVVF